MRASGRELWHYFWKTKGGTHIGSRGMAMWHDYVYFETPDNYLVSLEAKTGKERWHKVIADFNQQYFSTMAPVVIGNHVLAGTGNDLDAPGFLQSFDPETGELQWKFYTVPKNQGDPGLETWGSLDAARHGGAQVWIPGSYDPETKLYIFGTGNPTPAYTEGRGEGDNLFTCSLIAVNVDTGKMAWYYQTSPHDKHDWDSAQTPVLFDGQIDGKPRKLVATAARNGYFFVLDRTTGERLVSGTVRVPRELGDRPRRQGAAQARSQEGCIDRRVARVAQRGRRDQLGAAGVQSRHRPLLRRRGQLLLDLLPARPRSARVDGPRRQARSAHRQRRQLPDGARLQDRQGRLAGRVSRPLRRRRWRRPADDRRRSVFAGDAGGNIVAHDAKTGKPLWHSRIGNVTNAPTTFMLDGRQYLLVAAGDALFAFALY